MRTGQNITAFLTLALALAGCGSSATFPTPASSLSANDQNKPWPTFLPISRLTASNPVNPQKAEAEARNLEARAQSLRRRAAALRAPIGSAQKNLKNLKR